METPENDSKKYCMTENINICGLLSYSHNPIYHQCSPHHQGSGTQIKLTITVNKIVSKRFNLDSIICLDCLNVLTIKTRSCQYQGVGHLRDIIWSEKYGLSISSHSVILIDVSSISILDESGRPLGGNLGLPSYTSMSHLLVSLFLCRQKNHFIFHQVLFTYNIQWS